MDQKDKSEDNQTLIEGSSFFSILMINGGVTNDSKNMKLDSLREIYLKNN